MASRALHRHIILQLEGETCIRCGSDMLHAVCLFKGQDSWNILDPDVEWKFICWDKGNKRAIVARDEEEDARLSLHPREMRLASHISGWSWCRLAVVKRKHDKRSGKPIKQC